MRSLPDAMSAEPQTTRAPPESPILPSLLLHILVEPALVSVGETFAVTFTVDNHAGTGASELQATLSFSGAKVSVDAPELSQGEDAWHSARATLGGNSTATYTAKVTLHDTPAGGAVLARGSVLTAEGIAVDAVGGALVVDADAGTDAVAADDESGSLRTADRQVELTLAGKTGASLVRQLSEGQTTLGGRPAPPPVAGFKRGLPTVLVTTPGSEDTVDRPLEPPARLTQHYTLEHLDALGLHEDRLTVFRYDVAEQEWGRLSTHVDTEARTVTAQIASEGAYQLSEEFLPSEAYIPTLRDWQVALGTGTLTYRYPIDVPAGPAGIRPDLALSYSSGATDGRSGRRPKAQTSWVGKGWSLDAGSISMYKTRVFSTERPRFAMAVNGVAGDLIRAEQLVDAPSPTDPTHYAWRSTNETFVKVRAVDAGVSTESRGGFQGNKPYRRQMWQVWTKDGTRHEFGEDLWWGFNYCHGDTGHYAYMEAYRWRLSRTVDVHGNVVNYAYEPLSTTRRETCFHVRGTVDVDRWLTEITWGGNVKTGEPDRYRAEFISTDRAHDTSVDFSGSQYGGINGAPRDTRKLLAIRVWSMPQDAWQLVRRYDFDSDYILYSDARGRRRDGTYGPDLSSKKLALKSVTRRGSDGVSELPALRFRYLEDGGVGGYAAGGWQRLAEVDNGQGGVLRLTYENVGAALGGEGLFINHHRLITRATSSGSDGAAFRRVHTWRYSYGTPTYNSLGTALGGGGTAAHPNSAELYFNEHSDPSRDNSAWLLHPPRSEFRGHDYVREIGPDDAQTEHWFHVGALTDDPACPAGYPQDARGAPVTGGAILGHPCFQRLRDRERLKGREYRTEVRTSDGRLLSLVQRRFGVEFLSYTDLALTGGWRAFTYESELIESAFEGSTTPVATATRFAFEPGKQGGSQYGNRTRVEQRDHAGILLRAKDTFYAARDDGAAYIVDRPWQEVVRDGQENMLALTQHFYDELDTSPGALGDRGRLTRTSQYHDVRRQQNQQGVTLHGVDTTYRLDAYGSVVAQTSYDELSTRLWSGGGASAIGPAGNGQPGHTTQTIYHDVLHAHAVEVRRPNGLTTKTKYDLVLGTVVGTTDANGHETVTTHDVFGRMASVIRAGDTPEAPTVQAFYFEAEQPFRFVVASRERSGQPRNRPIQRFYDGLGREIQVKSESEDGTQNIVVDKQYDGYGQVVAESRPHFEDESPDAWTPGSSFWRYAPPDDAVRWTTTRYDAAGRALLVTDPDGSATQHVYAVQQSSAGLRIVVDDAMDANRHRTRQGFDAFGRLVEVVELTGACGVYGATRYDCGADQTTWAASAVTSYAYDPRDLLTRVSDAAGNQTTIGYDGLGRKTAMVDPDMGSWTYALDPSGNLVRQTDARGQVLLLEYDSVDRLTAKLLETWRDDFDDGVLTGWAPRGTVAESGGAATVTGTGTDWNSGLFRSAVATDRGGVTATFRVSDANGGAVIALHSGTYGQPDYRRWGIAAAGGNLVATEWTGTTEKATALMPVRLGSAYRVTLIADAQLGFRLSLEDLANPGARRGFQEAHADWSGRSWGFHAQVRAGTLVLEHYQHVDQLAYGYDQGPNGRGQQTSMSSPAATNTWRYDARGRIVEATHVVAALGQPRTFNWSYDSADRVTGVTYPRRGDAARESVSYDYDPAWHAVKLRSETFDMWYVGSATEGARYSALGQLQAAPMANGTTQEWEYDAPMQRLSRLAVRNPAGRLVERSYAYDPTGNVLRIRDHHDAANDQLFAYDHLDRLSRWTLGTRPPATYAYDAIGNLLSKAGVAYDYAPRTPWAGGPHAVKSAGGQAYAYDRNGNLLTGGGRSLAWSSENMPTAVTGRDGVVESYGYDAASTRVVKRRAGVATVYVEGLWEETVGAGAKSLYGFHGKVVAVREGARVTSLHHDHLGSVSVAASAGGGGRRQVTRQEFDPWGSVRAGAIAATSRNYTGHPLDLTGLVDAGARLYDPHLARFMAADSVVPVLGGCCCSSRGRESAARSLSARGGDGGGTPVPDGDRAGTLLQDALRVVAGGGGPGECGVVRIVATKQGGRALQPLTVAFTETALLLPANAETAKAQQNGFRFDGDRRDRLRIPTSMALPEPQALNRYAYALNNPLSYVDPTGHDPCDVAAWLICNTIGVLAADAVGDECDDVMTIWGISVPCTLIKLAINLHITECQKLMYDWCAGKPPPAPAPAPPPRPAPAPAPPTGGGGGGGKNPPRAE